MEDRLHRSPCICAIRVQWVSWACLQYQEHIYHITFIWNKEETFPKLSGFLHKWEYEASIPGVQRMTSKRGILSYQLETSLGFPLSARVATPSKLKPCESSATKHPRSRCRSKLWKSPSSDIAFGCNSGRCLWRARRLCTSGTVRRIRSPGDSSCVGGLMGQIAGGCQAQRIQLASS